MPNIICSTKEAENYLNKLYIYNPKLSVKRIVKLVQKKFGPNSVTITKRLPCDWVEHYENILKQNKEANAPTLIIQDLEKRLTYWRKRYNKQLENELPYTGDWKDFKDREHGVKWKIKDQWREFVIVSDVDYPKNAKILKNAEFEDHLEQLLFDGKNYYRYAGGGRGFYWTQLLKEI